MSWSYSGDPSISDRDMVRFTIGDTLSSDQQLTNEEIDAILSANSNDVNATTIQCLEALIARYSRYPSSKSVGDLSISYGDLVKNYQRLLTTVRKRNALSLAEPYAGGISIADKEGVVANTDRTEPFFTRDLMRNRQSE